MKIMMKTKTWRNGDRCRCGRFAAESFVASELTNSSRWTMLQKWDQFCKNAFFYVLTQNQQSFKEREIFFLIFHFCIFAFEHQPSPVGQFLPCPMWFWHAPIIIIIIIIIFIVIFIIIVILTRAIMIGAACVGDDLLVGWVPTDLQTIGPLLQVSLATFHKTDVEKKKQEHLKHWQNNEPEFWRMCVIAQDKGRLRSN